MTQKAKWPKYLFVPSEAQFKHGLYISTDTDLMSDLNEADALRTIERDADGGRLDKDGREEITYHCGTSCCFVGWVCLAFGEKGCHPRHIRNPATVKFLNKFIELAGESPIVRWRHAYEENFEVFSERVGQRASDVFEGIGARGHKLELSPRHARSLYKKAGEHFNYDTKNLLE